MDKAAYGYALAGLICIGTFICMVCKVLTSTEAVGLITLAIGVATGTSFLRASNEPARIEKVSGTGDGTKKE